MSNGIQAAGALKEYDVTITETLHKTMRVEATGEQEAERAVRESWRNGEVELDSNNFQDVEFKAGPKNNDLKLSIEKPLNRFKEISLNENEYVKELFGILKENGKDASGLASLINYVNVMDGFVNRMENTITDMKSQLELLQDSRNHPLRNFLKNTISFLEKRVDALKAHIQGIKSKVIEGSKNAIASFKEKGISALVNLASFFRIKDDMIQFGKNIDNVIDLNDKAISKINKFSTEYHAAGAHVKNMARVAVGREPLVTKKEAGKLADALITPYQMQNSMLKKLRSTVGKAVESLESMEAKKAERAAEKKPSLLEKLSANKERVQQAKRESPVIERSKAQGVEV